ncbi:MAG: GTP cyclohydrolase FolE2 [Desulfarculaceae bacterium]|nr:GTP cyclohydrolase FolE2 [Desulfarculaceae bacterium]MCF8096430.1 GTP cyclohydrolase FolE2 [Desulfarculaceae bacterium]MCF8121080.1 GTP cyclohydrolase FolE2 [Desulfarculaceae bacterium]
MLDVQNQPDHRNIAIDKVGVKNIRYPITVLDRANGSQQTVASINMYVNLPHQYKGTHMSRFIELLSEYSGSINISNIPDILEEMKRRLDAESAHIEVEFPYFLEKSAPVSQAQGLMEYGVAFRGSLNGAGMDLVVEIAVPVTTLCPCSKEISALGAHNQRGVVRLAVRFKRFIWIEDLIQMVENSASSEVFSLLKREDEKFVTERAYENPMFVEDVVREVASKLSDDQNIIWFTVDSENFESIHNHSAYAYIECDKRSPKA